MLLLVIAAIVLKILTAVLLLGDPLLPKVRPNVLEMIEGNRYPLERHGGLETEDGYILEMQRIPYGRNNTNQTGRIPVLVLHGLLASSAEFVVTGPEKGLAYRLADEGYDVWLGNCRGNAWSLKHKKYDPKLDRKQFWDFGFHEIAIYDLPAMIDYVLQKTGHQKLHYVGHSQGTTVFFILMSEKPQYNEKIRMMNALAPIVYVNNMASPFRMASPYAKEIQLLFWDIFSIYEFLPKSTVYGVLASILCFKNSPTEDLCPNIIFFGYGEDMEQYNKSLSIPFFANLPSGSSTKQVLHFLQHLQSGHFRKYDYFSKIINMLHYGQSTPPEYNITNVVAPVALHYGKNDLVCSIKDVQRLSAQLPNLVMAHLIDFDKFNHLDFLTAIDADELLYNTVVYLMKKY